MSEYIMVRDNVLTREECKELIDQCEPKCTKEPNKDPWNYTFYNLDGTERHAEKIASYVMENYKKSCPQIEMTESSWVMEHFKFQKFTQGRYYSGWHCEHGISSPLRIASIIFYLSDHDCGTEFYSGSYVQSKVGRVVVFPAAWTHMHRGQPCLENKPRYIMTSFLVFK